MTASSDACDRPGTPDDVKAVARVSTDAEGRWIRQMVLSWRNTASTGETVWWDIETTDGAGVVVPGLRLRGRPANYYHQPLYNVLNVERSITRCFRIKARTGPGTEGCVSERWSARVCATSMGAHLGKRHP
jgi:hypothetical protein